MSTPNRATAWLVVCLLASPLAVRADALDRLREVERELGTSKARAEAARDRARRVAEAIAASERERADLQASILALDERVGMLQAEERKLARERAALDRTVERRRREGATAAAWLMSFGRGGMAELVLAGESPAAQMRHGGTLRSVMVSLRKTVVDLESDRARLMRLADQLAANRAEQARERAQLDARQREATARLEQLQQTLRMVRRDESLAVAMVKNLEETRADLARLIAREQSGKSDSASLDSLRGLMRRPVEGSLLLKFGKQVDPVFGVEIDHPGWTFRTARGAAVRAVARGEVVYTGWLRGYGNLVVLQHGPEHFTLYGYLDSTTVKRGATVEEGDVIGSAGDSGSLYGPALHFEIRRGKQAIDPQGWFAGR